MSLLKKIHILGGLIALFAVMLILSTYFVLCTNVGLKFTLVTVPQLFGVEVSSQKAKGSFYRGFHLQGIKIKSKDFIIYSSQIKWIWANDKHRLRSKGLQVELLELGDVSYSSLKKQETNLPPQLPKSLHLPFQFSIDKIHLTSLSLREGTSPVASNGQFSLAYRNNLYKLKIKELIIFSSVNKGTLLLRDSNPFALAGQIYSYSLHDREVRYGAIKITDSLVHPLLEVNISNEELNITGYLRLSPFDPIATRRILEANIAGNKINPQKLVTSWADAELSFRLTSKAKREGKNDIFYGKLNISNSKPGYYKDKSLPLKEISLDFKVLENGTFHLVKGNLATIRDGRIDAKGVMNPDGSLKLLANISLGLINFIQTPIKNVYQGKAVLVGTYLNPILKIAVTSPWNKLLVDSEFKSKDKELFFNKFVLSKLGSYFEGSGKISLQDKFGVDLYLLGRNFNPNTINPSYPKASINGKARIKGNIDESLYVETDIKNSSISNVSLFAKGFAEFNQKNIKAADIKVDVGENHLNLKGKVNNPQDKMNIDIDMPKLQYLGFGFSGRAVARGYIQGTFKRPMVNLTGQLRKIKIPSIFSLDNLDFNIILSSDLKALFKVEIKGNGLVYDNLVVNNINSNLSGKLASHSGTAKFSLKLPNREGLVGSYKIRGGFDKNYLWSGYMDELNLSGLVRILLQNPVKLEANQKSVKLGAAKWTFLGGQMNLNHFEWQKGKGLKSKGEINNLALANLKNFVSIPLEQNIVVRGRWDLSYNDNATGYVKLTRQSGDIFFSSRKTPLGLELFDLSAELSKNRINTVLATNTRFASADAAINIIPQLGKSFRNASLRGQINLKSNNISAFKYAMPVGVNLKGNIDSKVNVSGTVGDPKLNGYLNGNDIEYRDISNGIYLKNGELNSKLIGQQWLIDQLVFKNKGGSVAIKGTVGEINQRYGIDLDLLLDKYLVMNQPNRQFIISGKSKIKLDEVSGLSLDGFLQLNKGRYENLKDSVPQLSDDVHILRTKKEVRNGYFPFKVHLEIDLNNQLRFILSDLDFLVGGRLLLKAEKSKPFEVIGKVVAVKGKYRAYGQNLRVETGSLIFTGDPSNAQMNIRARRYQSPVGVGVNVAGTFKKPRVTLISDISMSERDKLSWLILGRELKGEGDSDILALAVGVLAAEKVNKETGSILDNIGLSSNQTRNIRTGELNPAEQIVTFGKQLNENLYIGYEFGVQTSTQAVRFIYMISQSLNIFTRIGTQSSGGGIKYKVRFD